MAITSIITASLIGIGMSEIAATATSISLVTGFVFGGLAVATNSLFNKSSYTQNGLASSPTYQSIKYTQSNPDLPLPIIYGTVKTAGNLLWQNSQQQFSQKIVAFSEGEITAFTDIRVNDIPISSLQGAKVEKYYGSDNQLIAAVAPGASQYDKARNVGSLKNVAYLGLTVFNDNKINSSYNLTCIVVGKKIRVYSDVNNFTVQYSENPAWILFDFLTSYNGLGIALNQNSEIDDTVVHKLFDMNSFLESAAYCDELVAGQPRFTFNMIFDTQTSVRTFLDEIYRSCRGGLFYKNGLLQFKIDKAEPVSKVFSADDISNEVFKTIPSEDHYDILKCVYISPEHEWQKVEAFAEIPEYRDGVPIENTIEIFSCTNFSQAARLAWYYSNRKSLQPYFGSFDTDYRAYDLEVGDVIKFDSLLMGLNNYTVKVTQITDDGDGTFNVCWQTYDERLYQDNLGSLEPHLLVTKLNDLYSVPDDVSGFNIVQSGRLFNFVWNKLDNVTYEIRQGSIWDSAKIIASNLYDNFYSCEIEAEGTYIFQIKAFNKYNYSHNPAIDIIAIDYVPEQNIILQTDILSSNGSFSKTYLYQGVLKLLPDNVKWTRLTGVWNDVEVDDFSIQGLWGAKTFDEGYFISEVFDLGRNFQNTCSINYSAFGNFTILFRYANDRSLLLNKDFITFKQGEYSFRFFQFKVILNSEISPICYIKDLSVYIDVPDKTASYSIEITDAENGYLLNYSDAGFFAVPGIVATVTDTIYAYASTANKTPVNARIFAINNDGSKTTAKIDVQLFGY